MVDFIQFKAEVKKQLALRHWTYDDLAKVTGYKRSTIESLMCGDRVTENVTAAVVKALEIPEYMAS